MQNTVKVNYTESDKLTYTEWEVIHNAMKEEEKQERRAERSYYIKQKIMGGVLALCGILCPLLLGDCTASVFLLPLGICVMLTKDKVVG